MTVNSLQSTILIVDDESTVSEILRRVLSSAGYSCAVVSSVADAWSYLQSHDVDLVTLDVNMPEQSGLSLLPRLQQEFNDIAVIMLTAVGEVETAIEALTNGASDFLTKPIDFAHLLRCVHRVLKQRELHLQKKRYTKELEANIRKRDETLRSSDEQTVRLLVQASLYRDEETGEHIQRVGNASAILSLAMGWSTENATRIRLAAPLHDVGKIGVPDGILQKAGKLNAEEFRVMQSHVVIGASLLSGCTSPTLKLAAEIALNHHERWDGAGYMNGLSGTDIPQSARIVAVVDVYDALTHDRVYRPAIPERKALEMIREGRGSHFDPDVVDAFFDVLPSINEMEVLTSVDSFCMPSFTPQVCTPINKNAAIAAQNSYESRELSATVSSLC
jgi:putative two-component system response regulator